MDGLFLAACLWRESGFGHDIPLPFWSAPTQLHHRLALGVGTEWLAGFLACITAAGRAARDELAGLRRAETAGAALARTARSQLPRALGRFPSSSLSSVRVDRDGQTSPVSGNGNFRLMVRRLPTTLRGSSIL